MELKLINCTLSIYQQFRQYDPNSVIILEIEKKIFNKSPLEISQYIGYIRQYRKIYEEEGQQIQNINTEIYDFNKKTKIKQIELEINDKNQHEIIITNDLKHTAIKKIALDSVDDSSEKQSNFDNLNKSNISHNQFGQSKVKEDLQVRDKSYQEYFNKGLQLARLHNYKEAIEMYDEVIKINSNYFPALNNKGLLLLRLNQYQEAVRYFEQTILLQPNNDQVYNNIGITLNKQHKYEEALNSFNKAIQLNPSNWKAFLNKGISDYDYLVALWKIQVYMINLWNVMIKPSN
ncbi:unnamed protein product [Paramecium octaurelia]|uniref:Tetratricopeptide repeat protein n=1 Tax=Paramecium octaurelia TaxID=43137 RepID=A0A8S1SCI7_PAROT|nr:unnamed protein product [Paramecium octaurelia]